MQVHLTSCGRTHNIIAHDPSFLLNSWHVVPFFNFAFRNDGGFAFIEAASLSPTRHTTAHWLRVFARSTFTAHVRRLQCTLGMSATLLSSARLVGDSAPACAHPALRWLPVCLGYQSGSWWHRRWLSQRHILCTSLTRMWLATAVVPSCCFPAWYRSDKISKNSYAYLLPFSILMCTLNSTQLYIYIYILQNFNLQNISARRSNDWWPTSPLRLSLQSFRGKGFPTTFFPDQRTAGSTFPLSIGVVYFQKKPIPPYSPCSYLFNTH